MRKTKVWLLVLSLFAFVCLTLLGTFFLPNNGTVLAAEGDAIASTYNISLVDGSPSLSPSDFASIEWVHAALLRVTFANGMDLEFRPVNDAGNGEPPLKDQRLYSADGEGNVTYEAVDWPCRATINFDKNEDRDDPDFALSRLTDGLLDIDFKPSSDRSCADAGNFDVQPTNPDMSIAYFAWVDENTISTVDGESPGRFTRAVENGTSYFIRDADSSASSCIDKALVDPVSNSIIWWELRDDNRPNFLGDPPSEANADPDCKYRTNSENEAGAGQFGTGFPPNNRAIFIAGEPTSPLDITDIGVASSAPTCESEGGVFSFILCPALDYANDAIGWLDDRIINALTVNNEYYEDESIKEAWSNMRNVGYIVLIPVLLFMVIGTALQFNFLDAYTVKRALPRLFVAIIFMAVSYDVSRIMIEIVNGVGRGIGGLIAAPFGGYDNLTLPNIFSAPEGGGNLVWGGILGAVGIASLFVVSIGILFSYLFVAVLALLIIFILLSVRELLIIFLLIMSPLAIIAWIFPGNDKMWKLWWSTFTKMLYIFPIIMAILTTGRAFAYIIKTTPTEENAVVLTVVKLTAFIGPYFFIPKAFQMAGGAFANLAGMVNDRGKGIFDRQRKFRAKSMENKRKRLEQQGLVRPTGAIGRTNFGKKLNERGAQGYALKNAVKRDGLRGLSVAGMNDSLDRKRIHEEGAAAKDEVLDRKGKNDNFLHMLEMVMKGESDAAMMQYLGNNGYNTKSARLAIIQGKNMYDQYGHGLGKIISDGKAASKTSQTADFAEHLRNIWELSHGDEGMMMELIGSGSAAFNQAGRLSMSGGSFGEKAAMAKAFANVGPDGRYNADTPTIDYYDEITGKTETIDFSEAMGPEATMTVQDVINRRQRQKARDSFGTWDWSRIHPTDVKSVMSDIHSSITETSAQLRGLPQGHPERAVKERLLGQQISQLQSLRQNAMQTGNDEVKRIVADAYDTGTPIDINIGGKQYNDLSTLIQDAEVASSGVTTQRVPIVDETGTITGERLVPVQLPNSSIPESVISGYKSVKVSGGLTPEQMEQMRQQNTPT